MPQIVEIPGVGEVEFPESMDAAAVAREAAKLYKSATQTATTQPPGDGLETALDQSTEERRAERLFEIARERKRGERLDYISETALGGMVEGTRRFSPVSETGEVNSLGPLAPVSGVTESIAELAKMTKADRAVHVATKYGADLAEGIAADIGSGKISSGAPNTFAALSGKPLAQGTPETQVAKLAVGTVRTVGGMAPAIAGTRLGVPPSVAFGTHMGLNALAETGDANYAARQAVTGALLGKAGEAGALVGEAVGLRVVAKLPAGAENATIAAAKLTGQQAGMNAMMLAGQAPELVKQWQEDPAKAVESIAHQMAIGFAISLPSVPAAMRFAMAREMADGIVKTPEYKSWLDHEATQGGKPRVRGTTDPLLDPLAGSRVRQSDVTPSPLVTAAAKAEAVGAPATAEALKEQSVRLPGYKFPGTPEVVTEAQVTGGTLERGQPPFKAITVEPDGSFSVQETGTRGAPIVRQINIAQLINPERGSVRESVTGGRLAEREGDRGVAADSAAEAVAAERKAPFRGVEIEPKPEPSTPLKSVSEILGARLARRDLEGAVQALSQQPAKATADLINDILGIEGGRVSLRAAEKVIFNEVWEKTVQELGSKSFPKTLDEIIEATTPENLRGIIRESFVREWNKRATTDPALLIGGEKPKFIKSIEIESAKPPVSAGPESATKSAEGGGEAVGGKVSFAAEAPTLLRNAELWADRKIAEGGKRLNVGADPELLAAYIVKGAAVMTRGVVRFAEWSKEMVTKFGEEIRPHLNDIYNKSITYRESFKAIGREKDASPPTTAATEGRMDIARSPKPMRPAGEFYSEPLVDRLRRLGGPVTARVSDEFLGIINKGKRIYGELSTQFLDEARKASGKAFRGGTAWVQGIDNVTPRAATSRFHEMLEERVRTSNFDHVPVQFRPLAEKLFDANLAVGRLAQQASPGFVATGKPQRMLTGYGHDVVMRGRGRAWEAWAEGLAAANGKPVADVKTFLRRWKRELDAPGADTAALDKISQDFTRHFPKAITHIKPLSGWHEVIHSSPFSYLEQAGQRTANAVAFREVYPSSTGYLASTRKAVQAELDTGGGGGFLSRGQAFDNVVRAMQGHPIDSFRGYGAPDTVPGATARATQIVTKPIRSLMLTGSATVNVGETLSGGAQIFLGYGNAIRAAATRRTLYKDLERAGMVNPVIRDWSFDPTQPARSISRYAGNFISRLFLNDYANEFQEYTGAATARLVADEIRAGTIDPATKGMVVNTMRVMGITKENAQAAADGLKPEVLEQFETKAAEFLSSGAQVTAEKSSLGASRLFNELFWFHSYPMSKVRQTRSVLNNIIEDAHGGDWNGAYQNSKLMGRMAGGTVLGGAITVGLLALLREGLFGTDIKKNEAQDDFGGFVKEAFLMGYGGPLQIANRIWEQGGGVEEATAGIINASPPATLARELSDAAFGSGKYEGLSPTESVAEFLQSKTPGLKPFKRGMAVWGLSQDDPELDASIRAFYRWRNDELGSAKFKPSPKEKTEHKEFRGAMKQAVNALKDGDMERFDDKIGLAAETAEDTKSIKASFGGRRLLSGLSDEEKEKLNKRIGDKAFEKLLGYDAMLESLAK